VMMAEILMGRRGRQSPINTMAYLADTEKSSRLWIGLGWMGVVAGFLILSYYSVIAGWAMAYVFRSALGAFVGQNAQQIGEMFAAFIGSPEKLLVWHSVFMLATMVVVARGVKKGLEKAVVSLMPLLFILLAVLIGYALSSGAFTEGFNFLFAADFGKVFYLCKTVDGVESCQFTFGPILTAMGHAFFTLSLGMGAIMVYGSYMPNKVSIAKATFWIAGADTLVALMAGLAIFPIVFANHLQPAAGPGLIFTTLPIAFGQMAGGQFFGSLFFILLVFAAWTSSISLIEPAVAWLVENRGLNRLRASVIAGIVTWAVGILTIMSFSDWAFTFHFLGQEKKDGLFDVLDILTANIMLPLGGLLMAIYVGWVASRKLSQDELAMGDGLAYRLWYFVIRFVSPLAVLIVLLNALGVF